MGWVTHPMNRSLAANTARRRLELHWREIFRQIARMTRMFPVRAVKMPAPLITQEKATHRWSAVVIAKRKTGPVLQVALIVFSAPVVPFISMQFLRRSEMMSSLRSSAEHYWTFHVKSALFYLKLNKGIRFRFSHYEHEIYKRCTEYVIIAYLLHKGFPRAVRLTRAQYIQRTTSTFA